MATSTSTHHGRTGKRIRHNLHHKTRQIRRHRMFRARRTGAKVRRPVLRLGHLPRKARLALQRKLRKKRHTTVRRKKSLHKRHVRKGFHRKFHHRRTLHKRKVTKRTTKRRVRHDRRRNHHKKR